MQNLSIRTHAKRSFLIVLASLVMINANVRADENPQLNNLTLPQVEEVFKTFGAALSFRALEPASSYGKIWGVSGGVIAGAANARGIKNNVPGAGNISWAPTGDFYLGAQAPLGLALEAGFIPSMTVADVKFKRYGANVKWTVNEVFFTELPLDVAVRAGYATSKINYKQTISGVIDQITYDTKQYSGQLMASKKVFFFEPYLGVGMIKQSSTLAGTGTTTLYSTSVTLSNSLTKDLTTAWFSGGIQTHIFFMNLTAQADWMFGTEVYSAKLGFKF